MTEQGSGSSLAHRDLIEAVEQVIDHLHTANLIALAAGYQSIDNLDRALELRDQALQRMTPQGL